MHRRLAIASAFAIATLACPVALASVARADEGAPPASPSIRPPAGVIRHVDAPRLSAAPAARPRELVVLVGGYQSCACDATFDPLVARLREEGFDVRRFGADPRFPYDTYGAIAPNGVRLRDEIRSVGAEYAAVHLVTHSMGGLVADAAFGSGLSRADGVVTYVSWASPHSGSALAGGATATRAAFGGDGGIFRDVALAAGFETESDAIRDIAGARPPRAPSGVVRLDLREMTDVLVTARDAHAPGVETRTLTHAAEGHAGILSDPVAIDLTVRTIGGRRVPADERPASVRAVAAAASTGVDLATLGFIALVLPCLVLGGLALRAPVMSPFDRLLGARDRFIPRPGRRRCP